MTDLESIPQIESLARLALLQNNTDMARQAIAAADALASTQSADTALKTLVYSLELRSFWRIGLIDAIRDIVRTVESSPLSHVQKEKHHRAIAAVAHRQYRNHPELRDLLEAARQSVATPRVPLEPLQSGTEPVA
jgi:hypothetical protein